MAEVTPELVRAWAATKRVGGLPREIGYAYLRVCEERDRLRDEIADRANVEADLRARAERAEAKVHARSRAFAMFAGRELQAAAWDEGWSAGQADEHDEALTINPYRLRAALGDHPESQTDSGR